VHIDTSPVYLASPAVNASPVPEKCLYKYSSGAGEMYIGLNTTLPSSAPDKYKISVEFFVT